MRPSHRIALAALLAVALAAPVAPARAQLEAPPETGDGPRKLAAYATCAVSVFASTTLPGAVIAVISCFKIVLDEYEHGS